MREEVTLTPLKPDFAFVDRCAYKSDSVTSIGRQRAASSSDPDLFVLTHKSLQQKVKKPNFLPLGRPEEGCVSIHDV